MRVNVTRRVLFTFAFFTLCLNLLAPSLVITEEKKEKDLQEYLRLVEWRETYEMIVKSIKRREGFESNKYYCPGGILTIGYGHAIRTNESFVEPLTESEADRLLRQDLDSAIAYVQRTTDLEHIQLLAMSHFVFNVGSGNFYRSTLRQLIIADKPIDEEIIKWIHIKTNKGIFKSDWLLQSRKLELELFKLET